MNCFFVLLGTALFYIAESATYNQSQGIRNVYFAYGAYCDSSAIADWTCKWCAYIPGFEVSKVIDTDGLQAFVGYDTQESQIVISFRGSTDLIDWLDDLDAVMTPYPGVSGGEVHEGFYDAWLELANDVMAPAEALIKKYHHATLLITGHSLGAALAQLCALNASTYARSVGFTGSVVTYTYGSPRWGNLAMADYFATLVDVNWRMVNMHDVVPTVPPESDGFHHTWVEIWYTSDSPLVYTVCDNSGEDPNCSYIVTSVEDHLWYMDLYESCS